MIDIKIIENEFYNNTGKNFKEVDMMMLNVTKVLMIFELINIIENFHKKIISIEEIKEIKDFSCCNIVYSLSGDS